MGLRCVEQIAGARVGGDGYPRDVSGRGAVVALAGQRGKHDSEQRPLDRAIGAAVCGALGAGNLSARKRLRGRSEPERNDICGRCFEDAFTDQSALVDERNLLADRS